MRGSRRSRRSRNGAGSIARSPAAGDSVTRLAWRIVTTREELPIRRNTALLSASLAANSGTLQLSAAVASLTLVQGARRQGPARARAGDRARRPARSPRCPPGARWTAIGRVPILAARLHRRLGRLRARRARQRGGRRRPRVLAGLVGVGAASGTALLARTAAGDMYPPEHRAHGIALVLFGAVFGAILGPLGVQPAAARARARRRHARAAVAGGRRLHARRAGDRAVRAARPEADRRAAAHPRRAPRARPPRRCARSSAAPARSPRCSPARPRSR